MKQSMITPWDGPVVGDHKRKMPHRQSFLAMLEQGARGVVGLLHSENCFSAVCCLTDELQRLKENAGFCCR